MQSKATPLARALAAVLYDKINAQLEREAFMAYLEAIGEKCPSRYDASPEEAQKFCPEERATWIAAFTRAYRAKMTPEAFAESFPGEQS